MSLDPTSATLVEEKFGKNGVNASTCTIIFHQANQSENGTISVSQMVLTACGEHGNPFLTDRSQNECQCADYGTGSVHQPQSDW